MEPSKRFALNLYDFKEIFKYVAATVLVVIASDMSWIQEVLQQYLSPETAIMAMSILWPVLKRFAEDYEAKQ